jgi:hypothetical protein
VQLIDKVELLALISRMEKSLAAESVRINRAIVKCNAERWLSLKSEEESAKQIVTEKDEMLGALMLLKLENSQHRQGLDRIREGALLI